MKRSTLTLVLLATAFALGVGFSPRAVAQQHRATRLGDPAHRFADPLTRPEDLRRMLQDESLKADVAAILAQAKWKGNVDDLRKAAATAEITPLKLPKGTRMPFMSSRNKGKPVALIDVLWAGKQPIDAYAFEFASNGRRYRAITPKACANFFVVDLGPLPHPSLVLAKTAPAQVDLCDPIVVRLTVQNTGKAPAHEVVVTDPLPTGVQTDDGKPVARFEIGTLAPGETREVSYRAVAGAPGTYTSAARADSLERWGAEDSGTTAVRGPVLALECQAPNQVLSGRPIEVCLNVRNTGEAPERKATLTLPVPEGAMFVSATEGGTVVDGKVVWEVANLAPQANQRLCAVLQRRDLGALPLTASARGDCSRQSLESRCETTVAGIPAILLEVVDLEDPVEVGGDVTYEVRVVNQGSATITQVKLAGEVPEQQQYVSGSGTTAVHAEGRTVTMDVLPALAPKAEAKWLVVVKATAGGDIRFKIELSGDQFPRPIEEFEATTQY